MKADTRTSLREDPDAIAAKWVGRLDAGLTPEEQVELRQWRTDDVRNEAAFARFQATWSALGRARRTGAAAVLTKQLTALAHRQRRRRFAAAGAGLALLLAVGLSRWAHAPSLAVASSASQVVLLGPERRELPDGSKIEYPAGSVFSVDYSGPVRRVILSQGEALFQVAKNPDRAFVVEVAGVEVRAVGTAFSVQLGHEAVDVLVTEGTVRVEPSRVATGTIAAAANPPPEPEAAVLTVGQKTVVPLSASSAPAAVTVASPDEVSARLAWRNPRVEFSGARFSEVVAVMNKYNRVQFVIGDSTLADVPMSGLFRADDPETFLRMLESGFGVKAEHRSSEQIVLRKAP